MELLGEMLLDCDCGDDDRGDAGEVQKVRRGNLVRLEGCRLGKADIDCDPFKLASRELRCGRPALAAAKQLFVDSAPSEIEFEAIVNLHLGCGNQQLYGLTLFGRPVQVDISRRSGLTAEAHFQRETTFEVPVAGSHQLESRQEPLKSHTLA